MSPVAPITMGNNKVFISGIPDTLTLDDDEEPLTGDSIVPRILAFVQPTIVPADYKIIKTFPAREGFDRHMCLLEFKEWKVKDELLKHTKKLKDLSVDHTLKKVYIKHEQTPLTRKENTRMYNEFKKLRETHKDNEQNRVRFERGKLYLKDNVVDEVNLANQIFH